MVPSTSEWSYRDAFDRNHNLISNENQERIHGAHVAIAGLGGVGGIYATTLARLGVGHFTIADPDHFEISNTNRQQGAMTSTMGARKNETIERMIKDINPTAEVRIFDAFTTENAEEFLQGVTIALDSIDFFTIGPRRAFYKECRKRGIPVFGAGPIGFGTSMLNFNPRGMSFDEYFAITESMTEQEQVLQFALGICPLLLQRPYFAPEQMDFVNHRATSSVLGTLACANILGTEIYKAIIGERYESAPVSWQFDPYVRKLRRCHLRGGNRNPLQLAKRWYFKHLLNPK